MAFCTPAKPQWRWRIVSFSGDIVEESYATFASIATAVTDGHRRVDELHVKELARPQAYSRSNSYHGGR
jgi:hypothetical protein